MQERRLELVVHLQQVKLARDCVDLFDLVGANGEAGVSWLAVELRLAAVGNQMDFQPGSDRPVVNVHQVVLTVYAATDLGERSGEPRSLSVAKIIQRHRAGLL